MLTNAQAALIAAASVPPNPVSISYGEGGVLVRAEAFKGWLDSKDAQDQAAKAERWKSTKKPDDSGV